MVGRHAWKFFTALGLLIVLFGLGDMATGGSTFDMGEAVMFNALTGTTWPDLRTADPGAARFIDAQVRLGGAHLLVIGLLSLAITGTGLRRGERWAWFAMWGWPLWSALAVGILLTAQRVPGSGIPVPVISGSIILVLSAAVLALSYRWYVPKA